MEASAMRLWGNKVRLSNLFRRHSLLRESAQPPTLHYLNPHLSLQSKISQQPVLRGLLCSSLGVCLYMFHDTVGLHLPEFKRSYHLRYVISQSKHLRTKAVPLQSLKFHCRVWRVKYFEINHIIQGLKMYIWAHQIVMLTRGFVSLWQ